MNLNRILEELYSRPEWKFKLGLKNINQLLKKLKNPEKKLRCIHVAGSNGKGSVCAMMSSILGEAGYRVGMYTSPHLKKFNERIRINNKLISNKDIAKYYLKVKKYVTEQSFFEITTAMAYLYFKDQKVDFVVLETGMGGRLDATNVITPLASIITNVSKEHTQFLGKTIEKIAYEKAGIIKERIPVITATTGQALRTIKKITKKNNSILYRVNEKFINKSYDKKSNTYKFDFSNYQNLKSNLRGEFQLMSAAIAITALDVLDLNKNIKINEKIVKTGLRKVKWPARFEFKKNMIIDSAHNPSAFRLLFDEIKNMKYKKLILVLGFSKDKDVNEISKIIKKHKAKIILTQANNERALTAIDAKKHFPKAIIIENSKESIKKAKKISKKEDLILIAGSIYLVGEVV
ncbi:bifunctional folylpolyglutamate synthase/dihydrofolate synthase [Candidatus Woesearchaeota archaeon]|nr:bifunctional folylpolyglutamate synthase/dihydrofolate synthase [Candidatus Woesearchaeota archaeon]